MSIMRRRVARLLISVGLCFLIWIPFHIQNGSAASLGMDTLFSLDLKRVTVFHVAAVLVLLAALIPLSPSLARRRRNAQADLRFVENAERLPDDGQPRSVVSIRIQNFQRLPSAKRGHAAASLARYLDGSLQADETCARLRTDEFGLLLLCGDTASFAKRLLVLKQDVGFLYMAAYPALKLEAVVGACPLSEARGAAEALHRARTGGAPIKPEPGLGRRDRSA